LREAESPALNGRLVLLVNPIGDAGVVLQVPATARQSMASRTD
jgi:hypothetical protein